MKSKIRILTYHHIPNNGAFLFAYALLHHMQDTFTNADVKIIDYKSTRLALYEYFKQFKILPGAPLFYYQRARMWQKITYDHLDLEHSFPRFAAQARLQEHFSQQYDALVVGMDVWCLIEGSQRPEFPNIYWLPEKMNAAKIAYGVSAYDSNPVLIAQHAGRLGGFLDDFDVIGARDGFTYQLVMEHRSHSGGLVEKIPDPTFLYDFKDSGAVQKLTALGVDLERPLLGLLLYGDDRLAEEVQAHYHAKGYQILAMSMYNPFADFNLGHLLTPFEWAETFRYLSFCISDRFHGTVFCIKSGIPFISLEKERYLPRAQSKIHDLLAEFGLTECYFNPAKDDFSGAQMLAMADELEKAWQASLLPGIAPVIEKLKQRHHEFTRQIELGGFMGLHA